MRDERAKYLIVDAKKFYKTLYSSQRVASRNDFDTEFSYAGTVTADKILTDYQIPEKLQVVIFKLSGKKEIEEYITGMPFYVADKSKNQETGKKEVSLRSKPIYYLGQSFSDKYFVRTELFGGSFENAVYFLEQMQKVGCLERYIEAMREIMDVKYDLNDLFEAWHETHDTEHAMKLFRLKSLDYIRTE